MNKKKLAVIVVGLAAVGGVALLSARKASAATPPPLPGGPDVDVDDDDGDLHIPPLPHEDDHPSTVTPPTFPIDFGGPPPFVPPIVQPPIQHAPDVLTPIAPPFVDLPVRSIPVDFGGIETQLPVPISVPLPRPPRGVPVPAAPAPPVLETIASDTQAMVDALLARETRTGWKRVEPTLKLWQAARGLTADGKLGPGTNLRIAQEIGVLPIVRYWPMAAGPRPDLALADYREAIGMLAAAAPEPRRTLLLGSAERERGQSFGPPQGNGGKLPVKAGG